MVICDRLRELCEGKNLSQGDVEKRTGLLRCYISRVENGHTVPAVETLEKFARALEVPLYQLFHDSDKPPQLPNLLKRKTSDDIAWRDSEKSAIYLNKLRKCLSKAGDKDRKILFSIAQKLESGRAGSRLGFQGLASSRFRAAPFPANRPDDKLGRKPRNFSTCPRFSARQIL